MTMNALDIAERELRPDLEDAGFTVRGRDAGRDIELPSVRFLFGGRNYQLTPASIDPAGVVIRAYVARLEDADAQYKAAEAEQVLTGLVLNFTNGHYRGSEAAVDVGEFLAVDVLIELHEQLFV